MVRTVYGVVVIRKDLPRRGGKGVFMRVHNSSAVQQVLNCIECKDDVGRGSIEDFRFS